MEGDQGVPHRSAGAPRFQNYVPKGVRKNRAVEVRFDPGALREYVTGFRKRKDQRRARAHREAEKREREELREERAGRRKATRDLIEEAGLASSSSEDEDDAAGVEEEASSSGDDDHGDGGAAVREYVTSKSRVTVTVQPMDGERGERGSSRGTSRIHPRGDGPAAKDARPSVASSMKKRKVKKKAKRMGGKRRGGGVGGCVGGSCARGGGKKKRGKKGKRG